MLGNFTEVVLAWVLNSQVFLELVEAEFVASLELSVAVGMFLDSVVGKVDVCVEVVQ